MTTYGQKIESLTSLTKLVGNTHGPRDLKVIDHLDSYSREWTAEATCLFATIDSGDNIAVQIGGGAPGFVSTTNQQLYVPLESLDNPSAITVGAGWGSLLLVPGHKESLRVNGTVTAVDKGHISVQVSECYLHCAKAFMRSKFWKAEASTKEYQSATEFCLNSNFMLVGTSDNQRGADLSPKGDPAGKLLILKDNEAWFPDRPGNRRVDGFRNILTRPIIEIIAMVPGNNQVLRLSGSISLYTKSPMANDFTVNDKTPPLIARIEGVQSALENSPALERAGLWAGTKPELNFKASELWQAHMKASKQKGVEATLAKAAVALPGALQLLLDRDYKNNMY